MLNNGFVYVTFKTEVNYGNFERYVVPQFISCSE